MKKILETFHVLDDLNYQGTNEEAHWKLLENEKQH